TVEIEHGQHFVTRAANGQQRAQSGGLAAGSDDAIVGRFQRGQLDLGGASGRVGVAGVQIGLRLAFGDFAHLVERGEGEDGGLHDRGGERDVLPVTIFAGVYAER